MAVDITIHINSEQRTTAQISIAEDRYFDEAEIYVIKDLLQGVQGFMADMDGLAPIGDEPEEEPQDELDGAATEQDNHDGNG